MKYFSNISYALTRIRVISEWFEVGASKFLGYLITNREIEVNPH